MRIVLASYLVRGASTTVAMVSLLCSPRDCGHRTPSGMRGRVGIPQLTLYRSPFWALLIEVCWLVIRCRTWHFGFRELTAHGAG
jgi:hypothetical protein